jgi:hypothetical protein
MALEGVRDGPRLSSGRQVERARTQSPIVPGDSFVRKLGPGSEDGLRDGAGSTDPGRFHPPPNLPRKGGGAPPSILRDRATTSMQHPPRKGECLQRGLPSGLQLHHPPRRHCPACPGNPAARCPSRRRESFATQTRGYWITRMKGVRTRLKDPDFRAVLVPAATRSSPVNTAPARGEVLIEAVARSSLPLKKAGPPARRPGRTRGWIERDARRLSIFLDPSAGPWI